MASFAQGPSAMARGGELATKTFTDEACTWEREPSRTGVGQGRHGDPNSKMPLVLMLWFPSCVADGHRSNEISALQSNKHLGLGCVESGWRGFAPSWTAIEVSRKLEAKAATEHRVNNPDVGRRLLVY